MTRKTPELERWQKDIVARLLNLYIIVLCGLALLKRTRFRTDAKTPAGKLKARAAAVAVVLIFAAFVTMFPLSRYGRYALATWRGQPRYLRDAVLLRGREVNLVFGKEIYAGNGRWFSR